MVYFIIYAVLFFFFLHSLFIPRPDKSYGPIEKVIMLLLISTFLAFLSVGLIIKGYGLIN